MSLELIQKHDIERMFGIQIGTRLGEGCWGVAYELADDPSKVLKVSHDSLEYVQAYSLYSLKLPGFAKVFNAYSVGGGISFILREKVATMPSWQRQAIYEAMQKAEEESCVDPLDGATPEFIQALDYEPLKVWKESALKLYEDTEVDLDSNHRNFGISLGTGVTPVGDIVMFDF